MVAITPTKQGQFLTPVPAIRQNVELTGHGQTQALKDLLGQGDFCLEAPATFSPFGMIKAGGQGQNRLFIEERRQNPLVAEDIGQVLGMIFMPSTPWDLLPCFLNNRVVQDKKEDRADLNLKGVEELMQSRGQDLIHGPGILSEEASETGEGSGKERSRQRLDHRGGVPFFSQLDKPHDEGRKDFERRT